MESPDTLVAVKEYCRHWVDGKANNCHAPAVVIVWGKLAAPDEFGPRCAAHLPRWLDMHRIDQYAVFDLRGVVGRAADRQET